MKRIPRNENSRVEPPEPRENIEHPTSNNERRSERGFALPFDVRVECSSRFMRREHLQNSDVNRSYEPHRTGARTALSASSLDSIRADMAVRAPIGGLWILLLQ